jgi:hypothetical protein
MTTETPISFRPFSLGQIVSTPGALAAVPPDRLLDCLARHARGDWGCVDPEDAAENLFATHERLRILSASRSIPPSPARAMARTASGLSPRPIAA